MSAISDLPKLNVGEEKNIHVNQKMIIKNERKYQNTKEHNCSKYGENAKIISLVPPKGDISDLPISLRPKNILIMYMLE